MLVRPTWGPADGMGDCVIAQISHADVGRWEMLSTSKHLKELSSFTAPLVLCETWTRGSWNAPLAVLLHDVVHWCPFLRCSGVINIPAVALGMFCGGLVMKKYKLGLMGAAKFAFGTSLLGFVLSLFFLAMGCENSKVAGITVSYSGCVRMQTCLVVCYDCGAGTSFHFCVTCRVEGLSYQEPSLFSDCNSGCLCSRREWDPVCGENGITYVSPCLAGCVSSTGSGRNTVRHTLRLFAVFLTGGLQLSCLFVSGVWQLQVCSVGQRAARQPDGHSGPVSWQRQLRPNLPLLHGAVGAQLLHHLSRGNPRLHGAGQVWDHLSHASSCWKRLYLQVIIRWSKVSTCT